ncbi:hypothetical protein [Helicobacter brantae]|uniref:Outer membrane protein beta-barrel domain-containing protein n=1 Tax=Helicobacter brantae TaxID=375927 RepID=A0A3D8J2M1_9HELI|nr:hypothetical protein [Helicobacter brantae]RDU71104.1 hypothetical protein CQA58_03040 [Helicobacter brantae]
MKRIFAILFLCLYTTQSHAIFWAFGAIREASMTEEERLLEEEEEKKKKHFIGFSVGAGVGDISGVPAFQPRFFKSIKGELIGNSLEFALAIEGGWQKYTYEKVGYQTIFRGRVIYMSDFSSPIFSSPIPNKFNEALSLELSAGIDGIFDFIKNDEVSFGMILGINGGASMLIPFQEADDYIQGAAHCSYGLFSNLRTGFQVGLPTGFIDLILESSFVPLMMMKSPFNYTLSLGYKHFF